MLGVCCWLYNMCSSIVFIGTYASYLKLAAGVEYDLASRELHTAGLESLEIRPST